MWEHLQSGEVVGKKTKGDVLVKDFVITTDTGADLHMHFLKKYRVGFVRLPCFLSGRLFESSDYSKFYDSMKNGAAVSTSQPSQSAIHDLFRPLLEEGLDVIHIAISSGISGSFDACCSVANELCSEFPNRKIKVIDSRAAASGEALFYNQALKMQAEGNTFEETENWLEENRKGVQHLFTVDSLLYLQRGGRISKTTAVVGAALGVKPLLTVNAAGNLTLYSKTRGRRKSLDVMVHDIETRLSTCNKNEFMFISQADCVEDAEYCAKLIQKSYHCDVYITPLAPVIGAHSGPGTINISFWGQPREL